MSKIGRTPIILKENLDVSVNGATVSIVSDKGNSTYVLPSGISARVADGKLMLDIADMKDRSLRAKYGLSRANLANILKGITSGFEKKLEIQGVGYRAQLQGTDLVLSLGFSHTVKFQPHKDVKIAISENIISISGIDKALVGLTASKIRAIKPPEPYKGKGIRYTGEIVKRKVGKAAKAVGTK